MEWKRVYNDLDRRVKHSARIDRRNWLDNIADRAQVAAATNNSREVYRLTKQLAGRSVTASKPVRAIDGTIITNVDSQLERWTEHFRSVLNPPIFLQEDTELDSRVHIPAPSARIISSVPSLAEVRTALRQFKSGKAPGPDGLIMELLQADVEVAVRELHPLIRSCWKANSFPESWKSALLIKLPKKGDLSLCGNWRGIALQNSISKVVAQIVLNRIQPALDTSMRRNQAGFRRGRSCADQINSLRVIVEQSRELNTPLYLLFVDFKCAFNRLHQPTMWRILSRYGIPDKLVEIIRNLYLDAGVSVLHDGRIGASFTVGSGVKQGCILSPLIFNIVLDFTMRRVTTKPRGIHWNTFERLSDLDYADDIVLLSHTIAEMRDLLAELVRCAGEVGLSINVAKTKYMCINKPTSTRCSAQGLTLGSESIEEVDKFVYLGSVISTSGGAEEDDLNRIRLANVAFSSLRPVWSSSKLPLRLKIKIFNSNVKSVLMYGCETCKATQSLITKLQVFTNRCLRTICGIYYPELISNTDLLARTKQKHVAEEIGVRKWSFIGHSLRKDPADITRQAMSWNPPGRRKQDRPAVTWQSTVRKEAAQQGKNFNELAGLARNRIRFSSFVSALRSIVEP